MLVTPGQYHYMVSIEEMIQNAQDKTALNKIVLCEKHNNEQMEYYCNTCNVRYTFFFILNDYNLQCIVLKCIILLIVYVIKFTHY